MKNAGGAPKVQDFRGNLKKAEIKDKFLEELKEEAEKKEAEGEAAE